MISKQEVRLGNRVLAKGSLAEMKVVGIDDMPSLAIIAAGGSTVKQLHWEDLEGIPVTAPLLHLYGFLPQAVSGYFHKEGLPMVEEQNGYYMMQQHQHVSTKPVVYLHEVQNLYYSLTGREISSDSEISNFAEYRIGNYVFCEDKIFQIAFLGWNKYRAVNVLNKSRSYSETFRNIELSDELLVLMGFQFQPSTFFKHPLLFGLEVNGEGDGYYLRTEYSGYVNKKPIVTVNHLQNIVFAVTGQELTLDLR